MPHCCCIPYRVQQKLLRSPRKKCVHILDSALPSRTCIALKRNNDFS